MEPPSQLTYKQRRKIRSKMVAKRKGLGTGARNKLLSKLQGQTPPSDGNKGAILRQKLAALRQPLVKDALKEGGFKRDSVEGIGDYKGAQSYHKLNERVSGLDALDPKLAALQAKLTAQGTLRKRLGDARRGALPSAERDALKFKLEQKRVGDKSGGTPAPGQHAGSEPKPPTGRGPKPSRADVRKRKNRTP